MKDGVCVICLETIQEEESIHKTLKCTHIFHEECIDNWLQHKKECPICRVSVPGEEQSPNEIDTLPDTTSQFQSSIRAFLAIVALLNIMLSIELHTNIYLVLWCSTGFCLEKKCSCFLK